jgi:magnesium-transporting ATPase (P-type)
VGEDALEEARGRRCRAAERRRASAGRYRSSSRSAPVFSPLPCLQICQLTRTHLSSISLDPYSSLQVILSTSDPDGVCYVETKNLDGETNLKVRKSLKATSLINSEEDLEHAKFVLDVEPPNPNLYTFNALLKYSTREVDAAAATGQDGAGAGAPLGRAGSNTSAASHGTAWKEKLEPATINELLLRGCTIRNSQWIIGLVVFTGADTKIMLNGGETPVRGPSPLP